MNSGISRDFCAEFADSLSAVESGEASQAVTELQAHVLTRRRRRSNDNWLVIPDAQNDPFESQTHNKSKSAIPTRRPHKDLRFHRHMARRTVKDCAIYFCFQTMHI